MVPRRVNGPPGTSQESTMPPAPLNRLMQRLHAPVHARRVGSLASLIVPHLRPGDRMLDVGCGAGSLAQAVLSDSSCPEGVEIRGLEVQSRPGAPIEVETYDGRTIPLPDRAVDVVLLADVLHHADQPARLLRDAGRVARRLVIVKDHHLRGPFAHGLIALMDWAGNSIFGVPCRYEYLTPGQWRDLFTECGLKVAEQHDAVRLFPPLYRLVFPDRLHLLAYLRPSEAFAAPPPRGAAPTTQPADRTAPPPPPRPDAT